MTINLGGLPAATGEGPLPLHEVRDVANDIDKVAGLLTVKEGAQELKCSKAHLCKIINGQVNGCTKLPVIRLGRKILIRRTTFERWKEENDR